MQRGRLWGLSVTILITLSARAYYYFVLGYRFDVSPLTLYIQFIDPELLKNRLWESIFYLRDQPPLFNLFLGVVLKAAPDAYPIVFHIVYLALGLILAASLYLTLTAIGTPIPLATALVAAFMLHPSTVLYENLLMYEYPLCVMLAFAAWMLQCFVSRSRPWAGAAFFSTLALIVLTRGSFHIAWMILIVAAVAMLPGVRFRSVAGCSVIPLLLAAAPYVKNYFLFGEYASSVYYKLNYFEARALHLSPGELTALVDAGKLSPASKINVFSNPVTNYQGLLPKTLETGVPLLDQALKSNGIVNWHHRDMPAVAELYYEDAKVLGGIDPTAYCRALKFNIAQYFYPVSQSFSYTTSNENLLRAPELVRCCDVFGTGQLNASVGIGVNSLILLPLALIYGVVWLGRGLLEKIRRTPNAMNRSAMAAVIAFCVFNILYVSISTILLSFGNHYRYRFSLMPLFLILLSLVAIDVWSWFRGRSWSANSGIGRFILTMSAASFIVYAILLAYSNCYANPFLVDDAADILTSRHFHTLWPLRVPTFGIPNDLASIGRPLVGLSLAINYAIGGANPFGYHVFNVLIHCISALLLFGIVRRTFEAMHPAGRGLEQERSADRNSAGAFWIAIASALIWAVHPLATEAVTYVIKRNESMMAMCYLLTLYAFIRGVRSGTEVPGLRSASQQRFGWLAASWLACLLGMGAKETMVTAPLMVYLYDRSFVEGSWLGPLRRRRSYYLALVLTWGFLGYLAAGSPRGETAGLGVAGLTPWTYLCTQFGVVVHYLRLTFWPDALCIDYFDWPVAPHIRSVGIQAVIIAALLVIGIWAVICRPRLGFLFAWFFIVLAPSSSVIPIREKACEYRMYLPLASIAVGVSWVAWLTFMRRVDVSQSRAKIATFCGLLGVIILALAVRTNARNRDYAFAAAIWTDAVNKRPQNVRAQVNLSGALIDEVNLAGAEEHGRLALTLEPNHPGAHNHLAMSLQRQGKLDEAIEHYRLAIAAMPEFASAHSNLCAALLDKGGLVDEAIEHGQRAVRLQPNLAEGHNNLCKALAAAGRLEEAMEQYREAVRLDEAVEASGKALGARAEHAITHNALGCAFFSQGKFNDATAEFNAALAIYPKLLEAHFNLGLIALRKSQTAEARKHFQSVLEIDPKHAAAKQNLDALNR